jgi:carboxylesterase
MAPALASMGYTCRAMCLPGYGMAPEEFAKVNRERWIAAIDREVKALAKDADQVWILGHSMGASLAVDYLLDHPDAAQGVVLLAPLIQVSNARSPIIPPRAFYEIGRHVFGPRDLLESVFPEDFRTNEPVSQAARVQFTPFAVYEQAFALMDHIGHRAPEIRAPMLMVLAGHDKVVDSRAAERYFGQVASEKKELMVAEDAAHVVPLDSGWQDVVQHVDAFVRAGHGRCGAGALGPSLSRADTVGAGEANATPAGTAALQCGKSRAGARRSHPE